MFSGFANVWTPVLVASHLKARPIGMSLAGEPIVLFRSKGKAAALIDRCPHRGVKLSLGQVTPDGCLACPFHAWQFDGTGAVRHIPLNPDAKRELLFATALPVRELGGLIWVHTGTTAADEPVLPEGLSRPGLMRTFLQVDWNCHWTRAMENMLDSPHVPYVHRTTIGRAQQKLLTPTARMNVTYTPTATGGTSTMAIDGYASDAELEFFRPNVMALRIPIPGKFFRMHAVSVPLDDRHTRMIIVGARDFLPWRIFNPLFNRANRIIADQDRAIVESSQPPEVPRASDENSVASDRMTLQFRKYYFETFKT